MRRVITTEEVAALRQALAARATAGWALYEGAEPLAGVAPEALDLAGRPGEVVLRAGDAGRLWRVTAWEERGGALCMRVRGPFGRAGSTVRLARDGTGPLGWGPDWFEEAVRRALDRQVGSGSRDPFTTPTLPHRQRLHRTRPARDSRRARP